MKGKSTNLLPPIPGERFHSLAALLVLVLATFTLEISLAVTEEAAAAYFSNTYQEARLKFIAAAKAVGGDLEKYPNPHQGAAGETLYTDVATFNLSGAKTILVLGSGTHGVEGFAGSAIQLGLLQKGITEGLPDDVGLLFYHALNPYGFSHLRRFNEDNVDLNRNFIDHHRPHPSNEGYDELSWIVEPTSLSTWENLKAKIGVAWYRMTRGIHWLQSAISRGQYNHPKGIFFGGTTETWSNHTLRKIVERHISRASRVVLFDVHTGLGEYGAVEGITEINPDSPRHEWMLRCSSIPITNPHAGDAVSPPVHGPLKRGFERLLPNAEVIAVSLEFGTYPPSQVLWALRAENYLHHRGNLTRPYASKIKAELKRMFYPQEEDWKRAVWQQGSAMVMKTLDCLRLPPTPELSQSGHLRHAAG
jgi:hypothetical protein